MKRKVEMSGLILQLLFFTGLLSEGKKMDISAYFLACTI